jgi:hypothetical protein
MGCRCTYKSTDLLESGVVGFLFDAGLEYARLSGYPFLTPEQRFFRSAIVGLGGVAHGTAVILVAGTGPIGLGLSLIVGWTIESWTANAIIKALSALEEQRHLQRCSLRLCFGCVMAPCIRLPRVL